MMRRSPMKQRTPLKPSATPMKRSPMVARSPMKSSSRRKHKIEGHHDKRILEACRGEPCHLAVPFVCLGEAGRDTVVPAHGNWPDLGKGMGLKAQDRYTVPACHACHAWLDQGSHATREEKRAAFFDALARWEPVRAAKLNKERT